MRHFQPVRWSLWLMGLFCLCSCSSLKVDVSPAVDWSRASVVSLQPPSQDPWRLSPVVSSELRQMGFTILAGEGAAPDLLVRFFVKEAPDLNEDGRRITRLQSFHLQFVDPASDNPVAVADYFYPTTEVRPSPGDGVVAAFAGLRQNIRPGKSVAGPQAEKAASAIRQPAVITPPAPQQKAPIGKALPHTPALDHAPGKLTAPAAEKVEASGPAEKSAPEQGPPAADQSEVYKLAPTTTSPWIPRLKSWGLENWGKERDNDY